MAEPHCFDCLLSTAFDRTPEGFAAKGIQPGMSASMRSSIMKPYPASSSPPSLSALGQSSPSATPPRRRSSARGAGRAQGLQDQRLPITAVVGASNNKVKFKVKTSGCEVTPWSVGTSLITATHANPIVTI